MSKAHKHTKVLAKNELCVNPMDTESFLPMGSAHYLPYSFAHVESPPT